MECNDVNRRICNMTPSIFFMKDFLRFGFQALVVHISVIPFLVLYELEIGLNDMKTEMKEKERTEC